VTTDPASTRLYPVYHPKCGGVAFYTVRKLETGDRLSSEDAILVDGSRPKPLEPVICSSCGEPPDYLTYDKPEQ